MHGRQAWTGNGGATAGNCCGRTGALGTFDGADSRTWSAAWVSMTAGAGD